MPTNYNATYDYIIIGGGAAGMSLLAQLQEHPQLRQQRVLLIDKVFLADPNKTWCYWAEEKLFPQIPQVEWQQIAYAADNEPMHQRSLAPYRYFQLRSADFMAHMLPMAETASQVDMLEASVQSISENKECATVTTDRGTYQASLVFDSSLLGMEDTLADVDFFQFFQGYHIRTNKPVFNPECAVLMDFPLADQGNIFFYTLTYSPTEALVEFTRFADAPISAAERSLHLSAYLRERFGITDYELLGAESGQIPMSLALQRHKTRHHRLIKIGIAGGVTRPSSGYTFHNIQLHSRQIVAALANKSNRAEDLRYKANARSTFYDAILLGILQNRPGFLKSFIGDLFQNDAYQVLKFLRAETNVFEDFLIFLKLPWHPFLKQLINQKLPEKKQFI